jgi:multisubunit Na+/H+ antiporter MnhB subunit
MEEGYVIERPNRAKASSRTTRAIVVFLLLLSAALMLIVILGGWSALQSGQVLQLAIVLIYLVMAYYVSRWNRGPLPVAAAIAIILGIFAAVAAPGWFDRDKTGFATPDSVFGGTGLESATLGVVTVLIIPVQLLLIGFALQAFRQDWHVEVERPVGVQAHGAGGAPAPGRPVGARDRRARA